MVCEWGWGVLTQLLVLSPNLPKTQSQWVGGVGWEVADPTFDARSKSAPNQKLVCVCVCWEVRVTDPTFGAESKSA